MNNWINSSMLLYTTEKCNMKCSYCYNDTNIDKAKMSDQLSYEELKSFMDFVVENDLVEKIMVSWWEPLIWENFDRFINDYKDKKQIVVFTNWTKVNDKLNLLSKWIDVKVSLHWLTKDSKNIWFYNDIITSFEQASINYWLIYLVTKKNFANFFDDYKKLRESSKTNNFSLKFQPIILSNEDIKFTREVNPQWFIPSNLQAFDKFSLHWLTPKDWLVFRDNILRVIDFESDYVNKLWISDNNNSIYDLWDKSLLYHERLRDFYLYWKKVSECNTWPMLILWANGDIHQCMFLFNNSVWNIKDLTDNESRDKIINILANKNRNYIKNAWCFSEECLWAMRPM